jgi:outer membrane receptor protein involved in Fe transport
VQKSVWSTILASLGLSVFCLPVFAARSAVKICVRDQRGDAIAGASMSVRAGASPALSDNSGCAVVEAAPGARVEITHAGFTPVTETIDSLQQPLIVVMHVAGASETVEVTAARTPLPLDASASSVRIMTRQQLSEAPGFMLDDRLRQVAGFQLFRRTSSWVANPTSQGTSLRGLGSTAASRTLVLSDEVPLNDAFGGWVHWNEIPELAVRDVELMRGGASDLYGSSAIGGVIDVVPVAPSRFHYAADVSGASKDTSSVSGLLAAGSKQWSGLGAATLFRTGGFVTTAPDVRGPVDVPSNVHSQSGRLELRRRMVGAGDAFLRGNFLNEARSNGTPLQTNATRIWRYVAGANWSPADAGRFLLRLYGTDQNYRQSFSAIAADRASERLTNLQRVPSQQIGGALQWARSYGAFTLVAGGDLLDTRGTDNETGVRSGVQQPTVSISARQRDSGIYGEMLWQPATWSIALSSRLDRFRSFDAGQVSAGNSSSLPGIGETIFDPRLGIVKRLGGGLSLTASGFRAFRGPTLNELYRKFQVGQQITLANGNLRSERATGAEAGALMELPRWGSIRGSYFWTEVNRPVSSITLTSTPTSQVLQRVNLGQLASRGLTAEFELEPASFVTLTGGYQYAVSTVTKFQADPSLVGNWTPQVPRNSASVQARFHKQSVGTFDVDLRTSGRQYDDSANRFQLDGYGQVDLYAEHDFGRWKIYSSVQNLLDSEIQVGRTPLLTLGAPRLVAVGVRIR